MTTTQHPTRDALLNVWIARCPKDLPEFGSCYVFAAPNPPRLERTAKKYFVWNDGFTVLKDTTYHRLFKGVRLHPSEGPRHVRLSIERANSFVWVARYPHDHLSAPAHYVFGTLPRPKLIGRVHRRKTWTPCLLTLDPRTFLDIFTGLRLNPGQVPLNVTLTATLDD